MWGGGGGGDRHKRQKLNYLFKVKMYLLLVPYINYQGQKLTKSKKNITRILSFFCLFLFSTDSAEGTRSHHSLTTAAPPEKQTARKKGKKYKFTVLCQLSDRK